jgi:mannose-6-phosphate isomerase
MTSAASQRQSLRQPLPLAYHPLYRFYEGGSLTRRFRGLPERPDDWWSEDWVGSCTCAGNPDPDGHIQGLSTVDLPSGRVTLKSLAQAWPEEMGQTDVLVKLLSPSGPVPLHAHPTRAWARRHLGSPFGKTEAWILLDTPGDGREPAYAGIGFQPDLTRDWFADGRFSIAIVAAGDGWAEGDFGRQPISKGQAFAWPASLALRVRAGREPVRIVRCLGPQEA